MNMIEHFGASKVQDFLSLLQWLEEKNITVEEVKRDMEEFKAEVKRLNEDGDNIERAAILNNPRLKDIVPLCPVDQFVLRIIESPLPEWESELVCKCGHKEYLDISVMDYQVELSARIKGTKPDFDPEEIRISKEKREARREICQKCKFLTGKICRKCGCSMKHRTYYEILTCPDKRW